MSFLFLTLALKNIPVGTAYAVWTGIGTTGTVIFGVLFWEEVMTPMRMIFLSTLILSIIGLKAGTV